jgi:AcrR family transcriptional regulator
VYIAVDMKSRKYEMRARQQAKDSTRDAIIKAAVDAFMAERSFAITLPTIAERAEVTVKTVLRHFGTREAVIDAAWAQAYDEVMAERTPPPGDIDGALKVLIAHYERRGNLGLAMLADENDPRAVRMNNAGRLAHREWVEEVFTDRLPRQAAVRTRLVDVLVVATDVYAWKLLRLDRGLSVDDVHDRMLLMTEALLATTDLTNFAEERR